jgi:hypothetical protein
MLRRLREKVSLLQAISARKSFAPTGYISAKKLAPTGYISAKKLAPTGYISAKKLAPTGYISAKKFRSYRNRVSRKDINLR